MTRFIEGQFDAVVIGAGHAGCEAALALARTGQKTVLLTLNLDSIGFMPCNPSIGGTAKGHLVREIDALGGEMGLVADKTALQIRMLNVGKGAAVINGFLHAAEDKRPVHRLVLQRHDAQGDLGFGIVNGHGQETAVGSGDTYGVAGLGIALLAGDIAAENPGMAAPYPLFLTGQKNNIFHWFFPLFLWFG